MKAVTALGIGTFIGAAIAILLAPKSGKETVADLTDRVNDSIDRGTGKAREIVHQTDEVAAQLKDQVQSVRGAVDAGIRAFKDAVTQGRRRPTSSSEVNDMERDYDIFERLPDASVRCLVRVHGTLHVRPVLEERGKQTANECYAMDIRTREIIARVNDKGRGAHKSS